MQTNIEPLFNHQRKIIEAGVLWRGLWLGTGSSKTRTALELAEGSTLVIAPKQQVVDKTWENNADRFGIIVNLTVLSKETFRAQWRTLPRFDTVIVDEAHTLFGVTPDTRRVNKVEIPKTSQLFESLRLYLRLKPPTRFYPATATPASKPMNVWAIATLFGEEWDFFRFREKYYFERKSGYRSIWLPRNKPDLKEKLAELLQKFGDVGRLQDWFDVPEQTHITHYVGLTSAQKSILSELKKEELDPMVKRAKQRTIENGILYESIVQRIDEKREKLVRGSKTFASEKIDIILEKAEEFPKMLIFANYTAQIDAIADALEKQGKKVYRLKGSTKDEERKTMFRDAEEKEECIVVAQSSMSSGYEWKSCPCVIFASKSYKYLDYDQAQGRTLRADALKKNLYIHLVVKGSVDQKCHDTILSGRDFQEKIHTKL